MDWSTQESETDELLVLEAFMLVGALSETAELTVPVTAKLKGLAVVSLSLKAMLPFLVPVVAVSNRTVKVVDWPEKSCVDANPLVMV